MRYGPSSSWEAMTTRDMAGPNAFLEALGDNRRLLSGAPTSPPSRASENLDSPRGSLPPTRAYALKSTCVGALFRPDYRHHVRPGKGDVKTALTGVSPLTAEIVGGDEVVEMPNELVVGVVVISLDGCVLDCPVHPLDLSVGPRVIGLGQPMFDPVLTTGAIERVAAEPGGRTGSVLWQIGELDAIVGEHDLGEHRVQMFLFGEEPLARTAEYVAPYARWCGRGGAARRP